MFNLIRNVLFSVIFYSLTVMIVLMGPVAALFGTPVIRALCVAWAGLGVLLARQILGIQLKIEGSVPDEPVLFALKHQSMYETMIVASMLGAPAVVVKRELMRIPFWGWTANRYGMIPIDRAGSSKALREMMKSGKAAKAEGRSIAIFPEGTRVAPGETPPLRSGFAGLYRALNMPVVPVALETALVWPRKGLKRPGTVTLRFGAVVPTGMARADVETLVHAGINALEPAFAKGAVQTD